MSIHISYNQDRLRVMLEDFWRIFGGDLFFKVSYVYAGIPTVFTCVSPNTLAVPMVETGDF